MKKYFLTASKLTALKSLVIVLSSIFCTGNVIAKSLSLKSVKTPTTIEIDGVQDRQWERATKLKVILNELPYEPSNGYDGLKETHVEIRSLYDEHHIYFLFRWYDPTISLARFPWEKQRNGSWIQLSNKDSTKHENTYYEDKLAIYWNINERGFVKKGCDKSCHMVEEGLLEGIEDSSSGRHYTKRAGETMDEWHWKSVRTNPIGQMDDGFVNNERETNDKWGRHTDDQISGGYYKNTNESAFPAWMNGNIDEAAPYWILDKSKVLFKDTFKPGDRIGGIVTSESTGSRSDVSAKGIRKGNYWQLEIKRKRITQHDKSNIQDIQFNDLNKPYYFGVTAFDNSQINHIYHKKSIKLTFQQ